MLKHLLIDISQDLITNSEEITAFSVYLLVSNTVNWQGEALHYLFNIGSAIVSGYIVHKLKKFWDKKEKRTTKKPNKP